ncbi:hypothetical protein DHX103_00410 [Planococcus sp. X10-3]|uniref:hypothetical protein n=1 Tax=Planococcus sp. X10-3 TaxID=3061240 RepID=UPI003BAE931F
MKKLAVILITSGLLLGACSSDDETTETSAESTDTTETAETTTEETEGEKVEVDKGLFSVEVTLPASFFEGEDMEQVVASAKEEGMDEAAVNDDGSVTYKMSKSQHNEMMEEMATGLEEAKTEIVESGDYPSIQAVESSKNYDQFTLTVDYEMYENSFDGFATMTLGLGGSYYQAFDGKSPEDLHLEILVEDAATGEVIDTIVYPDVLEEMGE